MTEENIYLRKCARCSMQGFVEEVDSNMFDVREGTPEHRFARPGEEFVCDRCMLSDLNYQKELFMADPREGCKR